MEKLYRAFYKLYMKELSDLRIGYSFNVNRLQQLMKIQHALYYLNNTEIEKREVVHIIEKFIK